MPEIDPQRSSNGKDRASTAESESEWSEWMPWDGQPDAEYRSRKLPNGETQYECRDAPRYWEYSNSASVPEYQSADSKQSSGQYENEPSNSLGPYQSPASYDYQQPGDFNNQITYQTSYTPNTQTIYNPSSRHSNQDAGETFGKIPYQNYASQSQTNQGSVTNTDSLPQFSPPKNLPRSKSAPVKVTQADPLLDISIFKAKGGERTCVALMDTGAGNGPWIARRIVDDLGFEVMHTDTALQAKLLTGDTITSQGVVNLTWKVLKGYRTFPDMQFNIFVSDHFDVVLDMNFLRLNGVVDFNIAPLLPLAEKTKETPEMRKKRKEEAEKQKQGQNASEERRKKAEEKRKVDKKSDKAKGSSSNNKKK